MIKASTISRTNIWVRLQRHHATCLTIFLIIVLSHWLEHLAQAFQVFVLHWPRPAANGVIGLLYPRLVSSELLHYSYAAIMLLGLAFLLVGFRGRARTAWLVALAIQFWHHIEHALLIIQALSGHAWFGAKVPTSMLQLVFPRLELHLAYNIAVTVPMLIAMLCHVQRRAA